MLYFLQSTFLQMGFWITWALIPICVEIIPSLISAIEVVIEHFKKVTIKPLTNFPVISIIVPIYNSERTLFNCIESIDASTYPNNRIQVLIADNGRTKESFATYGQVRKAFPNLNMQYVQTQAGKSNALNTAIFATVGKYILNIDSDGTLEKHALFNMIQRFENNMQISAMGGTILTQKATIQKSSWVKRLLQKNEYFEYTQAFLSGRIVEARRQQLFTLSGAFSAFRRDVLYRTQLYDVNTVGEDTDMTFQIRQDLNGKIDFCADAIFYTEPISGISELYTQRQRWQLGEIEVMGKFGGVANRAHIRGFFKNFLVRRLVVDHTFVFPKMIWMFASVVLMFFGYKVSTLLISYVVIYLLYLILGIVNFVTVELTMVKFPAEDKFFRSLWWCILTLPMYNFMCSGIRFIGVINSTVPGSRSWTTKTMATEFDSFKSVLRHDVKKMIKKGK